MDAMCILPASPLSGHWLVKTQLKMSFFLNWADFGESKCDVKSVSRALHFVISECFADFLLEYLQPHQFACLYVC